MTPDRDLDRVLDAWLAAVLAEIEELRGSA